MADEHVHHHSQESKVQLKKDLDESIIHVDGYESFFSFCTKRAGYSGTVTYVRKGLTYHATDVIFGDKNYDTEVRVFDLSMHV